MIWVLNLIEEKTRWLRGQICCIRCRTYYRKELDACPACTGVSQQELEAALGKRKRFRISLGQSMMIGALLFLLMMVIFAKSPGS